MRLLFVADGRSPIALNWISHFIDRGDEVHLASTFPCDALDGLASLEILPLALGGLYRSGQAGSSGVAGLLRRLVPVRMRTRLRQMLAPSSLPAAAKALQEMLLKVHPELVHAMRIPYEGMLAADALRQTTSQDAAFLSPRLLISVWGNDFTLHARSSPVLYERTVEVLKQADALHTDCLRDHRLAVELGFDASKPSIVLPGGGGVRINLFHPPAENEQGEAAFKVINPRGIRDYVGNDTFFHSIPLVLQRYPTVKFICPGMQGEGQAERWTADLRLLSSVELLPRQSPPQMAELFRQSQVMVSVTTHDGTPNTLLEGMASGCFPIAGDIESLREWITSGENGLLVDPADPQALAGAILKAIELPELRQQARERNLQLVTQKAEYGEVMKQAEAFYQRIIAGTYQ